MGLDELIAREAIRDTMARYTIAGDRFRFDDMLALFTEDALFESRSKRGLSFRNEGLEQIRVWMAAQRAPSASPSMRPRPEFVRHHLATSQIDVLDSGAAAGRTYWTVFTQIGADHGGHYVDRFRKVGDRWMIASRSVRVDWHAPQGLFRPSDWEE